jgi:osmoprotectant transport system permease protein
MTADRLERILSLTGEHVVLVAIAIVVASAIALPLAILLSRKPGPRRAAVAIANILQTIPSLALFGFLIPIPLIGGIGKSTAIVALVVYALLPLLRNTLAGILGVDPAVRESAVAMGMTAGQVLRMVELPLAAPTIMAGLRIATVTSIGTAVIAAAIGGGGLGVLIFGGISLNDSGQILSGAVPAAIMALLADEGLGWIERRISRHGE